MVQLWWYPSGPAGPKREEISKISTTTAPDTVGWPPRVSAGSLRRRRVDCRACPTEEIRRGECVEQRTKVAVFSSVGCAILNLKKKNLLDPHSGYDIVTSPPEEKLECCGGNQQYNTRPIGKTKIKLNFFLVFVEKDCVNSVLFLRLIRSSRSIWGLRYAD
jgi:hypothetical protein